MRAPHVCLHGYPGEGKSGQAIKLAWLIIHTSVRYTMWMIQTIRLRYCATNQERWKRNISIYMKYMKVKYESHQLNITSSWASSKAAFRPLIWIQCPRQKETSPCTGFAYVLEMHEWCGQNFPVKAVGSCYFHCDLQMYYFNPRKPPCTLHVQITIDKENIQHMNINLKEIFG